MKRPVTYMYKLKDERSFKKIFDVTCSHGDTVYCEYLQDGVRKSETYRDLEKRSLNTAYTLQQRLDGIPRGTFVGIHFDNCPEWPAIFWGILWQDITPYCWTLAHRRRTWNTCLPSLVREPSSPTMPLW